MSKKLKTKEQNDLLFQISLRIEEALRGHKQSQIAQELGVCWTTVHRYMYNGVDDISTLVRISDCLEVSLVYLLCGDVTLIPQYKPSKCPCRRAGQELRRLRTQKGITQEKMAEYLGIDPRTVQRYEAQGIPTITSVLTVAQYFRVSILHFLCD